MIVVLLCVMSSRSMRTTLESSFIMFSACHLGATSGPLLGASNSWNWMSVNQNQSVIGTLDNQRFEQLVFSLTKCRLDNVQVET